MAIGGDVLLRVAMLLPWLIGLSTGLFMFWRPWIWLPLALFLGIMVWAQSPTLRVPGRRLQPQTAPALMAELERLRRVLDAPPVHAVHLTDDLNAAAACSGLAWLPWGQRRTLLLGVPLLALLTPSQASAVIAHELGHFSRRHGVLGHWVYRARLGWMEMAGPLERDDSPYGRTVAAFANWFVPRFEPRAMALSRWCEFEADADAAQAASPEALVQALLRLEVAGQRLQTWHAEGRAARLLQQAQAPADHWDRVRAELWDTPASTQEQQRAWQQVPALHDSHPALAQRAQALGLWAGSDGQPLAPPAEACAGATWLSDWPGQWAQAQVRWQAEAGRSWPGEHVLLRAQAARLAELEAEAAPSLERARLQLALGHVPAGLLTLRMLRQQQGFADAAPAEVQASQAPLLLHCGLAALQHAQHAVEPEADLALAWLDAAVRADSACAWPARRAAWQVAYASGQAEAEARQRQLVLNAARRLSQALAEVQAAMERGDLLAPDLPAYAVDALHRACEADPPVQGCWLGQATGCSRDGKHYPALVLVLRVDAEAMARAGEDEETLCQRYQQWLGQARNHAGVAVLVRVRFLAEQTLPPILDRSSAVHWRRNAPPA
jgi:Zn-dependent protease with chaperone function